VYTDMELWAEIRRRVLNGELSKRAACKEYGLHWDTLQKMLRHTEPPGYRLSKPRSSKLDSFLPVIHEMLESDRSAPRKPRHTAKRIATTSGSTVVWTSLSGLQHSCLSQHLGLFCASSRHCGSTPSATPHARGFRWEPWRVRLSIRAFSCRFSVASPATGASWPATI